MNQPHLDIYAAHTLDRRLSSRQLADELTRQLEATDPRDTVSRNRIETARVILGDPQRRAAYDGQFDDPAAPPISESTLAAMAGRPVQTAPRSGGLAAAFRSRRVQVLAGVAALLVVVLVIVIVAVTAGGDNGGSDAFSASTASTPGDTGGNGPVGPDGCQEWESFPSMHLIFTDPSIGAKGQPVAPSEGSSGLSGPEHTAADGSFQQMPEGDEAIVAAPGGICRVSLPAPVSGAQMRSIAQGSFDGHSVVVQAYYHASAGVGTTPGTTAWHLDVVDLGGKSLVNKDFPVSADPLQGYSDAAPLAYVDGKATLRSGTSGLVLDAATGKQSAVDHHMELGPVQGPGGDLWARMDWDTPFSSSLLDLKTGAVSVLTGTTSPDLLGSPTGLLVSDSRGLVKEWTPASGLGRTLLNAPGEGGESAYAKQSPTYLTSTAGYLTASGQGYGVTVTEIATGKVVYTMSAADLASLSIASLISSDGKYLYTWTNGKPYRTDLASKAQTPATAVPVDTVGGQTVWRVGSGDGGSWSDADSYYFAMPQG